MQYLGFERFAAVGHDRGAYTAFRLALDYSTSIDHLVVLDAVPIIEALERCNDRFARSWWHWFFYAQPKKPEAAINADPDGWYQCSPESMTDEAFADFQNAIHDPVVVHGMVEDYRAGLSIDHLHDAHDRFAGRKVQCPALIMWSTLDDLEALYGDVMEVWKSWLGGPFRGKGLPCGHHMAEEIPRELALELRSFLR